MKERVLVWALLGLLSVPLSSLYASAQGVDPETSVKGKWFGTLDVDGLPQPIWIEVANMKPGDSKAAVVSFSLPRDCLINLQYAAPTQEGHILYVARETCRYIERSGQDFVTLRITESGGLFYSLTVVGTVVESTVLNPQ